MNQNNNLTQRQLFKQTKEACQIGDLKAFQSLTDKLMFEEYNNYGYDLLYEAGTNGHLNIVKYLFEDFYLSQYVNFPDYISGILIECCEEEEPEIIRYVMTNSTLNKEVSFEKICMDRALKAARSGQLTVLQALLHPNKNSSPNGQMLLYGDILSSASQHGHIDIVKYILEAPELANYHYPMNDKLAFKSACSFNEMEVIKYFIFDINIELDNELKFYFDQNPNEPVIKLFELRDINKELKYELVSNENNTKKIKDMNKYTHLSQEELNQEFFNAIDLNDFELVEYLLTSPELEIHAEIQAINNRALRRVADKNNVKMFDYLLKSPKLKEHANINIFDDFIFKNSCAYGCVDIVKYILETPGLQRNVSEAVSFKEGVDAAYEKGKVSVIKYLIDDFTKDYDLNHYHLSKNMFNTACIEGYLDLAKYIINNPKLNQHIDISEDKNNYFRTACSFDHFDIVEYFIFELNLPKTDDIIDFIEKMDFPNVEEMFKKRDLHNELQLELGNQVSFNKKIKI